MAERHIRMFGSVVAGAAQRRLASAQDCAVHGDGPERPASDSPRNRLVDDPGDPGMYQLALERLAVPAEEAIVIEDSRNGLLAAVAAGLRCVVTVSSYTVDEDMREAALVVARPGVPANRRGSWPTVAQRRRTRSSRSQIWTSAAPNACWAPQLDPTAPCSRTKLTIPSVALENSRAVLCRHVRSSNSSTLSPPGSYPRVK